MKDLFDVSSMSFVQYLFFAGLYYWICYFLFKKTLSKAKIQQKEITETDVRREIFHSTISSFIMTFMIYIVVHTPLKQYTNIFINISDYSLYWLIGSILIGLFIHDTYFYWLHRLLHNKRIFKHSHIVHHQSNNPTPFASYSFHYIEAIGEGLIIPFLFFIVPFHIISLYCFIILAFLINVYGHLGYEIAPKWFRTSFLFQVFNSSVYHNLHHSKFLGNYSLYFRFWDKIMGTENPYYTKIYDKIQEKRFNSNIRNED